MSRTDFNPSTFDKQAAASLDMIDEQAAAERVQRILHPEAVNSGGIAKALKEAQAGPTLTPAPQTQPTPLETLMRPADSRPVTLRIRKKRSDAGTHKPKAPADPDEIVLKLKLEDARRIPLLMGKSENLADKLMAWLIQDQIIAQLQRRLDQLQKAPK